MEPTRTAFAASLKIAEIREQRQKSQNSPDKNGVSESELPPLSCRATVAVFPLQGERTLKRPVAMAVRPAVELAVSRNAR